LVLNLVSSTLPCIRQPNFKKETPYKTQYMKLFKHVNKQAKTSPLAKGGKKKKK
jgi:hypothetical protein